MWLFYDEKGTTRTAVGTSSPLFVQDLSSGADHKCYIITKLDNDSSLTSTSYSLPITTNTVSISYTDISATPIRTSQTNLLTFTSFTKTVSGATGSYAYANGTYDVSYSSSWDTTNFAAYLAFSNSYGYGWLSKSNTYNTTTGVYSGTVNTLSSSTTLYGEWIQIKLPYSFLLKSVVFILSENSNGVKWYIVGSNDRINWTTLSNPTLTNLTILQPNSVVISTSLTYTYFRFIMNTCEIKTTYNAAGICQIGLTGDAYL